MANRLNANLNLIIYLIQHYRAILSKKKILSRRPHFLQSFFMIALTERITRTRVCIYLCNTEIFFWRVKIILQPRSLGLSGFSSQTTEALDFLSRN